MTEYIMAGGSALSDLWQSLEEYLPVLLGLVKDGEGDEFIVHRISFRCQAFNTFTRVPVALDSCMNYIFHRKPDHRQSAICVGKPEY